MIIGDTPAQLGQIEAADAMMIDGRVVTRDDYRALVAQLGELSKLHSDLTNADMVFDDGEHSGYLITTEQINEMEHLLSMPAACLAQVRSDAGETGYYNGFKAALILDPPLPPATGTSATVDVFQYRIEQASRYAAGQYANRLLSGGAS